MPSVAPPSGTAEKSAKSKLLGSSKGRRSSASKESPPAKSSSAVKSKSPKGQGSSDAKPSASKDSAATSKSNTKSAKSSTNGEAPHVDNGYYSNVPMKAGDPVPSGSNAESARLPASQHAAQRAAESHSSSAMTDQGVTQLQQPYQTGAESATLSPSGGYERNNSSNGQPAASMASGVADPQAQSQQGFPEGGHAMAYPNAPHAGMPNQYMMPQVPYGMGQYGLVHPYARPPYPVQMYPVPMYPLHGYPMQQPFVPQQQQCPPFAQQQPQQQQQDGWNNNSTGQVNDGNASNGTGGAGRGSSSFRQPPRMPSGYSNGWQSGGAFMGPSSFYGLPGAGHGSMYRMGSALYSGNSFGSADGLVNRNYGSMYGLRPFNSGYGMSSFRSGGYGTMYGIGGSMYQRSFFRGSAYGGMGGGIGGSIYGNRSMFMPDSMYGMGSGVPHGGSLYGGMGNGLGSVYTPGSMYGGTAGQPADGSGYGQGNAYGTFFQTNEDREGTASAAAGDTGTAAVAPAATLPAESGPQPSAPAGVPQSEHATVAGAAEADTGAVTGAPVPDGGAAAATQTTEGATAAPTTDGKKGATSRAKDPTHSRPKSRPGQIRTVAIVDLPAAGGETQSYVSVSGSTVTFTTSAGQSESFDVDEAIAIPGGVVSDDIPENLLSIRSHLLSGHNTSVLMANSKNHLESSKGLTRKLIDEIVRKLLVQEAEKQTFFDLSMTLCVIDDGDKVVDLFAQPPQAPTLRQLGSNPIYGPCIMNLEERVVHSMEDSGTVLAAGFANAQLVSGIENGIMVCQLVLKQVTADGTVYVSSLMVALADSNVSQLLSLARKAATDSISLFKYALGGASVTSAVVCLPSTDPEAEVAVRMVMKLGEMRNSPPRSGNVSRFMTFSKEELERQIQRKSDAEKSAESMRVVRKLEMMIKDCEELLSNPKVNKPKVYSVGQSQSSSAGVADAGKAGGGSSTAAGEGGVSASGDAHAADEPGNGEAGDTSETGSRSTTKKSQGAAAGAEASNRVRTVFLHLTSATAPVVTTSVETNMVTVNGVAAATGESQQAGSAASLVVDEIVTMEVDDIAVAQNTVTDFKNSVASGCTVALIGTHTNSRLSPDRQPLWVMYRRVLKTLMTETKTGVVCEASLSLCAIENNDILFDAVAQDTTVRKATVVTSPIFGSIIHGVISQKATTALGVESTLGKALAFCGLQGSCDTLLASALIKQILPGGDVLVSTFSAINFNGVEVLRRMLDKDPREAFELVSYPLGGSCTTATVMMVEEGSACDPAAVLEALEVHRRIRETTIRPPRVGSVKRFVLHSEDTLRRNRAKLQSGNLSASQRAVLERSNRTIEVFYNDYMKLLATPLTTEPRAYRQNQSRGAAEKKNDAEEASPEVVTEKEL